MPKAYFVFQFCRCFLILWCQSFAMATLILNKCLLKGVYTQGAKNSARTSGFSFIVSSKSAAVNSRTSLAALTGENRDNEAASKANSEDFKTMLLNNSAIWNCENTRRTRPEMRCYVYKSWRGKGISNVYATFTLDEIRISMRGVAKRWQIWSKNTCEMCCWNVTWAKFIQ